MKTKKDGLAMSTRVILCLLILVLGAVAAAPALATEPAAANQDAMNPVAPSAWKLDLAIWTAVVFLCLLAILWAFAWRPITEGLDKREQSVADQIAQAATANKQAKGLLAEYERKLAAAANQVRTMIEQGRRDADAAGHELIDKAKEEAKAEYQRAVHQIDAATAAAIKELAGRSATLAVELAGKIVRTQLNPSDHARLIQEAVEGFAAGRDAK
jgi:F-type H+-transporting ATPase subunit b